MVPTLSLRTTLFRFVQQQCTRHHIDDSHGLIHSKRCVSWVDTMTVNDNTLSADEKTVAVYSAAIHDLCDKKYVSAFESIAELREWLIHHETENPDLRQEVREAILSIIQTMSYSYLNQRKHSDGTNWYPDHGAWIRSYHLARQADLLEGLHVGRCYLYTKHAFPQYNEEEIWFRVEELFKKRMYHYVTDGWITNPVAMEHAPLLIEEAKTCFRTRVWDYKDASSNR